VPAFCTLAEARVRRVRPGIQDHAGILVAGRKVAFGPKRTIFCIGNGQNGPRFSPALRRTARAMQLRFGNGCEIECVVLAQRGGLGLERSAKKHLFHRQWPLREPLFAVPPR
jgi:hypothetical protein